MHKLGIKIHLHCFEYGRGQQPELQQYCEEVIYYHRESLAGIPLKLPYIVTSRINALLLKNLLKDNYPVLLEGIHCTYYLYHGELMHKKVVVQMHNVEYQYYRHLARASNNLYKKIYYNLESRLLKKYENLVSRKAKFIAINEEDKATYQKVFLAKDVVFLPAFLPYHKVKSLTGTGTFCLYHGNLSVAENEKTALWLLQNIFNHREIPLFIAGKNPSKLLKEEAKKNKNTLLFENPTGEEMKELIQNAQLHLMPSFNNTGIKIKMLNVLFNGRFVITNAASLRGTGLDTLCEIAESPMDYEQKINQLFTKAFSENDIDKRKQLLEKLYDNEKNAHQLISWL